MAEELLAVLKKKNRKSNAVTKEWIELPFSSIVEMQPKVHLEKGEKYDFIPMDIITGGEKYVQAVENKIYSGGGAKFENEDTLFARITPCLENGKIIKVKNLEKNVGFGSTEFFVFRAIENVSDSDFVYYLAISDEIVQPAIKSMVGASGRQRADKGVIENVIVSLPPLIKQKKISSILSAYDDLIENNQRRIKLLEESSQMIYKEWFVNLRFPEFQKTEFVNGMPENWIRLSLYDIAEVQMGFPFKGSMFNEDKLGHPIVRIRDIPQQWTNTYSTENISDDYIVNRGDILIGMDGFFHINRWGGQKSYLVQRVCRIRAKNPLLQGYLHQSLKNPIRYFEKTITGSTVAHLGAKHLKEIDILVPNEDFTKDLSVFNDIDDQILNLHIQNQLLKEARDILLPRLINGTIKV